MDQDQNSWKKDPNPENKPIACKVEREWTGWHSEPQPIPGKEWKCAVCNSINPVETETCGCVFAANPY
jgi:hypothetical protein